LIFILAVPSPEPHSTRGRSKISVISNNNVKLTSPSESLERPLPPTTKKTKKASSETSPIEIPTNNKRKNTVAIIKKGKRRLHSVEQDEGLNTADEDEVIQTISPPIEITPIELSQEEREKVILHYSFDFSNEFFLLLNRLKD
jgi:hypothetical protein